MGDSVSKYPKSMGEGSVGKVSSEAGKSCLGDLESQQPGRQT